MEHKEKGRIKRRNMIAKKMLVDQRVLYHERRVLDKKKKKLPKINLREIERELDEFEDE